MALSAAAILPHSPLLIPAVAGDNIKQADSTISAIRKVANDLKNKEIDSLIVISGHGPQLDDAFTLNHCPKFLADFEQFGDLITKLEFASDIGLAYKIKESLETKKQLVLACEEKLDYSVAVPMYYFQECCPKVSLIPLYTSHLTAKEHYELGELMRSVVDDASKKIAVVAVGDLSRSDQKENESELSRLKEFDDFIIRSLKKKDISGLENIDHDLLANSGECLYFPLLVLLGLLGKTAYQTNIHSYERPFSVGMLTASLEV